MIYQLRLHCVGDKIDDFEECIKTVFDQIKKGETTAEFYLNNSCVTFTLEKRNPDDYYIIESELNFK